MTVAVVRMMMNVGVATVGMDGARDARNWEGVRLKGKCAPSRPFRITASRIDACPESTIRVVLLPADLRSAIPPIVPVAAVMEWRSSVPVSDRFV